MKSLLCWLAKKLVTKSVIKSAIHAANNRLAVAEAGERSQKVLAVGEDVSATTAVYLAAFADDGKMDADELKLVNAQADAMVDKYIKDGTIEAFIEDLLK